jgi:hypothetical protein
VLSFLVTSFFARAKKEVTRSSAGGVEALLQDQTAQELDSSLTSLLLRAAGMASDGNTIPTQPSP